MSVFDKRLILVVGKGGVGRSTVSAALGAAAARQGRRTLLFEYNANDRYGGFFDTGPVGDEVTRLRDNLFAINTTPGAALREYGLMVLRFQRVYEMVFENRVTRYFLRAIPGLDDYSILGKCWYHTTETGHGGHAWDTVIFDMAATGHSLSMLTIPKVILETVPEGPLTRDARKIMELLRDRSRCAIILTTLAEEMPAAEARELSESLRERLELEVAHLVINQVYPSRFPPGSPERRVLDRLGEARELPPDLAALADHADRARLRRELNERYLRQLEEAIPAPNVELPLLFRPGLGPQEIDHLSHTLESQLGAD